MTPPDAVDQLRAQLAEKCRLLDERSQTDNATTAKSIAQLQAELQQMTVVAQQWQAEATRYQQFAEQWQQYQLAQVSYTSESCDLRWYRKIRVGRNVTSRVLTPILWIARFELKLTLSRTPRLTNNALAVASIFL